MLLTFLYFSSKIRHPIQQAPRRTGTIISTITLSSQQNKQHPAEGSKAGKQVLTFEDIQLRRVPRGAADAPFRMDAIDPATRTPHTHNPTGESTQLAHGARPPTPGMCQTHSAAPADGAATRAETANEPLIELVSTGKSLMQIDLGRFALGRLVFGNDHLLRI